MLQNYENGKDQGSVQKLTNFSSTNKPVFVEPPNHTVSYAACHGYNQGNRDAVVNDVRKNKIPVSEDIKEEPDSSSTPSSSLGAVPL